MGKINFDPTALLAVAGLLVSIANDAEAPVSRPTRRKNPACGCSRPLGRVARPLNPTFGPGEWGVAEVEPREDRNKVFGINVRVDEPRREDYCSRWAFERDHEKFDRLVDAAEACTWSNKSNTAPLHRVNAIRRRIEDGPVMGLNLLGESHWF